MLKFDQKKKESVKMLKFEQKKWESINACVKEHLEPTHLKSSPLFTFSTKSLRQDSPLFQNYWVKIHHRENKCQVKIHQGDLFMLGQGSLSNKEKNKKIKPTFVQDSPFFEFY